MNTKYLKIESSEDICKGEMVAHVYRRISKCIMQSINESFPHEMMSELSDDAEKHFFEEIERPHSLRQSLDIENTLVICINGVEKAVRINHGVFKSNHQFILDFHDFLKELEAFAEMLKVEIGRVSTVVFVEFLIDSFCMFGSLENAINLFRPMKSTAIQRSGLESERMLRMVFLLQQISGGMRLFLSFHVFAVSIYHGNKYIEMLIGNELERMISEVHACKEKLIGSKTPEFNRYTRIKTMINALYLLFDIFDLDNVSLKNIFCTLTVFLSAKKCADVVKFLGPNDLFVCTVRSVCGDLIPMNTLMMTCKVKLNMKYKANALGVSMDYIYSWLYLPYFSMLMPRYIMLSKIPKKSLQVLGRPIEMASSKITMEFIKDKKNSEHTQSPMYSPLSKRLSSGINHRIEKLKSKRKLEFN
ncbi:hypothetical protein CWI42_040310 [Ordospora colligata]|uniref:Uncharacterized protein n=1 Tax=Ordospora colligata OC4 TaxID=1354746 RepID=A0A0B2UKT5_9MICR|nr:uncharacterized protein M896_040310 [Ordospora colligata OC4]KHN69839.1 hypothetical protein M896_040310 [Ordospora colligata OC4]TBU16009.1 hypothetical protein CWI41_040310 [Ordospora colligata]TBU16222.1 hypothetical protein CWI40_040310 [Ordospora colligata]TBU18926.1 hypothetical protein CWI42_040310 [Ordospora colligata]